MSGTHEAKEARVTTQGRGLDAATATTTDPPWTKLSRDIEAFLAEETASARVDEPSSAAPSSGEPSTLTPRRGTRAPRHTEEETSEAMVGSQIGHYDVVSCLGRGGMGAVYRCRHRLVHSHVAIKLLHEGVDDPTVFERFVREARAANVIQSAHVLPILDFGQLPDGRPYAVMEQLVGESVEARFMAHGPLPLSEVAELCRQTAIGMAAAHEVGILHRDLKPANLFLERRAGGAPFVRILDFGVCKIAETDEDSARLTVQGFCVGTPQFCSPEQATARSVSEATDIYSLGAVAYELLSGTPTFEGSSIDLMVRKNLTDPISIGALCPWLPEAAVALISEMLDRRPGARPRSMDEVARRFAALVQPVASVPLAPSMPPSELAQHAPPSARSLETLPRAPMQSVPTPHTPIAMSQVVKIPDTTSSRVGRVVIGSLTASCAALFFFIGQANVAPLTHGVSAALGASIARGPGTALSMVHDATTKTAASHDVSGSRAAMVSAVVSHASPRTTPNEAPRSLTLRPSSAATPSKPPAAPKSSPLVDPFQ